jgi:hypothetical protein
MAMIQVELLKPWRGWDRGEKVDVSEAALPWLVENGYLNELPVKKEMQPKHKAILDKPVPAAQGFKCEVCSKEFVTASA